MNAASDNIRKNPAQAAKILAKITPEEMEDIQSTLQGVLIGIMMNGETLDTVTAYLKINEKVIGYVERAVPLPELAKHFVGIVEGLGARDVQILRDLGLPKSAQIIEYALTPVAAAPKKSAARKGKKPGKTL